MLIVLNSTKVEGAGFKAGRRIKLSYLVADGRSSRSELASKTTICTIILDQIQKLSPIVWV